MIICSENRSSQIIDDCSTRYCGSALLSIRIRMHFRSMRIQIHCFDEQHLSNFYSWTENLYFFIKNCNHLSVGLPKNVQATVKAFSPRKRTSSTSKHTGNMKLLYFLLFLWVIFALLDPDPADKNQCRSWSTTLVLLQLFKISVRRPSGYHWKTYHNIWYQY